MQTHKEGITERWLKDGAHFGIPRIYAASLPCVHLCHDENRIEVKFRVGVCRVRRVRRRVWVRVWAGLVLRDIYTYIYIYIYMYYRDPNPQKVDHPYRFIIWIEFGAGPMYVLHTHAWRNIQAALHAYWSVSQVVHGCWGMVHSKWLISLGVSLLAVWS